MRILVLTRYDRLGASSRVRFLQFMPYLQAHDIQCDISPLFGDDYVQGLYSGHIPLVSVLRAYAKRLIKLIAGRQYDLIWLEKEALPWLPAWLETSLLGRPLVIDYDDAWFHRYDSHRLKFIRRMLGSKIDKLMAKADLIIAGNAYIAERAKACARRVEILPTVVDDARYRVSKKPPSDPVTIGWIGSPGTTPYLKRLGPVLKAVTEQKIARIIAIGAGGPAASALNLQTVPWREDSEVENIGQFDIGIMPVPDEAFERGKCGYKLIQYMACGIPVVASPVGANREIVRHGLDGFLADSESEWMNHILTLCADPLLRARMGEAGRARVSERYSLMVAAPRLLELLRSV